MAEKLNSFTFPIKIFETIDVLICYEFINNMLSFKAMYNPKDIHSKGYTIEEFFSELQRVLSIPEEGNK